jgi:hypothetical protein
MPQFSLAKLFDNITRLHITPNNWPTTALADMAVAIEAR